MARIRARGRWLIVVTFLIAFILEVLPVPSWAIWLRPHWTLLVLIYWVMDLPYLVSLAWAFCVGIFLDLLTTSLLGEHAFALVVITFAVLKLHKLIRVYPVMQQTIIICILLCLYQLLIFMVQGFISTTAHAFAYWLPTFTSTILWPWMYILLRDMRYKFHVG